MPQSTETNITLEPVTSSHLAAVGYDPATNTLAVKFRNTGTEYRYAKVTPADYDALRAAKSIGSHFIINIQRNPEKFPFTRITPTPEA